MSAVAEEKEVEVKRVVHHADRAILLGFGADLTDHVLVNEYYEYRDSFNRPGQIDQANLHRLVVEQKRRKAKAEKKGK